MFKFSLEILDLRMNVGIVQMVGSRSHSHQFVVLLLIMGREMDLSPERFPSFSHGEVFCPFSLCVSQAHSDIAQLTNLTPKKKTTQSGERDPQSALK